MIKLIRLLVESFFDDEIFNVENDIKNDLEDLGKYYEYKAGEIFYQNKKPYAVCCGESKYFKDDKSRFCLLTDSDKRLKWRVKNELVKKLLRFKFKSFNLKSFNDFLYIDDDGYKNTQIIKNNYDITEFPAFEYCLNLGENTYLPAIDELLMLYLNKDKLKDVTVFGNCLYWSSTLYYTYTSCFSGLSYCYVYADTKNSNYQVRPFFRLD